MEKTQADAIAQAILEPDLLAQAQIRQQRAAEAADLARKRRVAWLALAGSAIGAGVACFSGERFTLGILWGGLAAAAVGWFVTHRAAA